MFRSVDNLLRPASVAIVGASERGGAGWPLSIWGNLEQAGFPARVYLINPRRDVLWGQKVYPTFASLPEPVDLSTVLDSSLLTEINTFDKEAIERQAQQY